MNDNYGLDYIYKDSPPTSSVISFNLQYGNPIVGAFTEGDGHVVCVYGITSSGILQLHDPNGNATSAEKSGSKYVYYTPSGSRSEMYGALCRSWGTWGG